MSYPYPMRGYAPSIPLAHQHYEHTPTDLQQLIYYTYSQLCYLNVQRQQLLLQITHNNSNNTNLSPDQSSPQGTPYQQVMDPHISAHGDNYPILSNMTTGHENMATLYQQQQENPQQASTNTDRNGTGRHHPRRRRHRHRRGRFQPGTSTTTYKYIVDPILDDHDGSVLAELINSDTQTAWSAANALCYSNPTAADAESTSESTRPVDNDIVFFTDASSRRMTECSSDRDRGIHQWELIRDNPAEWRSGVAIAWTISSSSALYNDNNSNTTTTTTNIQNHPGQGCLRSLDSGPVTAGQPMWTAQHEAAWQISGLQHYDQAELLGILFALERAVLLYRTYYHLITTTATEISSGSSKKLSKSITILTDSKPAMWDLTGSNWHTDSMATESAYWVLRRENTRRIVKRAKHCLKFLRSCGVSVRIQWVPGHRGVPGNEWVDKLSRFARLLPSRFGAAGGYDYPGDGDGDGERTTTTTEEDGGCTWREMELLGVEKEVVVDTRMGVYLEQDDRGSGGPTHENNNNNSSSSRNSHSQEELEEMSVDNTDHHGRNETITQVDPALENKTVDSDSEDSSSSSTTDSDLDRDEQMEEVFDDISVTPDVDDNIIVGKEGYAFGDVDDFGAC